MVQTSVSHSRSGHGRWFFILSVVVTLALYLIPFGRTFAYPFLMLSTFAHEMGHGLTALAVGANFKAFYMWGDGSGVAYINGYGTRVNQAIIAAGGLMGPALLAAVAFLTAKKESVARFSLTVLGSLLIVSEFLFVRNMFGWIFVGVVAAFFLWLGQQSRGWLAQGTLVFVGLQLALSVFSRSDYLFTATARTDQGLMPSDVAQIADALFLPYWFWGGICGLLSVLILFSGLKSYIKS